MLGVKDDTDFIEHFLVISISVIYFYLILTGKASYDSLLLIAGMIIRKVLGINGNNKNGGIK